MKNHYSLLYENWQSFKKNPLAITGSILITILIFIAIFAPVIAPFSPYEQNIDTGRLLKPLEEGHIFGTDEFGRDVFSRVIYGARISLVIGTISIVIGLVFGTFLGLFAGFYGSIADLIIMRIIDMLLAFPSILLAILIVAALGPSLVNAIIAIGILQIPGYARLIRSKVIAEKEKEYILAEKSLGANDFEIIFLSILPNCLNPIFVKTSLGYSGAILSSAALSYLGLGAQEPTPSWGLIIARSQDFIEIGWWIVLFPGLAILLTVLGFNLLGDGLRDILDPNLQD